MSVFSRLFLSNAQSGYAATASDYDGTNDYALRGADLTGLGDSKLGLLSFWVRINGADGTAFVIFANHTAESQGFTVQRNASNHFSIQGRDVGNTLLMRIRADNGYTQGIWYHVIASWNLANAAQRHVYVNDTADMTVDSFIDDNLELTKGNWGIGGFTGGASKLNGCLSEFYFHNAYLDLSVEANRRKFISAAGKPVDLGADGSTPLSAQPIMYSRTGDFSTNLGSGGNFTNQSTLTACASSPSG